MLTPTFTVFANHLLASADWARERLREHAGKVAMLDVFFARIAVAVAADGTLRPAAADAAPAATIRLTSRTLLQVLADGEEAWRRVEVDGDTGLASAISQVAANLRWDVEEDLSRLVGDIAAHRLALAGRAASRWPKRAAASIAENAAEYLTEEAHVLVTPLQAAEFVRDVDDLRDATERLGKRIERLGSLIDGN